MSQEKLEEVLMSAASLMPAADIMVAINKNLERMPQYVVACCSLEECKTSTQWLYKLLMQMYIHMSEMEERNTIEYIDIDIDYHSALMLWQNWEKDTIHVRLTVNKETDLLFQCTVVE